MLSATRSSQRQAAQNKFVTRGEQKFRVVRVPECVRRPWGGGIHWPGKSAMILRKDCKCPCHRAGHAILHVVPCCGPNGPGSDSKPRKRQREPKKEKIITLFANQEAE